MDKPAFFFVAHVLVKHNGAKSQLENFKKLTPTATNHNVVKSPTNPLYVTFVATFDEVVDFIDIKNKLTYYYGGKSKILKVHHSTTDTPTYFFSAHLVQNFTPLQKHNNLPEQKHDLVRAVLALIATKPKIEANVYDASVLVEFPDHDVREEDVENIKNVLHSIPQLALLTSREQKKE